MPCCAVQDSGGGVRVLCFRVPTRVASLSLPRNRPEPPIPSAMAAPPSPPSPSPSPSGEIAVHRVGCNMDASSSPSRYVVRWAPSLAVFLPLSLDNLDGGGDGHSARRPGEERGASRDGKPNLTWEALPCGRGDGVIFSLRSKSFLPCAKLWYLNLI